MVHSFHDIQRQTAIGPPTLFLPGWGFDGRILQLLNPSPGWIYPATFLDPGTIEEDLLHLVSEKNFKKIKIIGWSMGAMLALEFAARHSALLDSLVLIALRPHWPWQEIKEIQTDFSRNPQTFLKGFYRKCFLGDKPAYRKFSTILEPHYLAAAEANRELLLRGLRYLGEFALPRPLPDVPVRMVHGKQDIVAPVNEMMVPTGAEVEVVDNAGHVVFLHEKSSFRQELKKLMIREKFSRAAGTYDNYAKVQTEIARRLAAKLPPGQEKTTKILEIGCGTGTFTSLLAGRYQQAKIVALDFSPEMLKRARRKLGRGTVEFICADGEEFLEQTHAKSFDLVVSNGSLQWFADIAKTLNNIARILKEGGSMLCTIFGPESLKELGKGLQAMQFYPEKLTAQAFPNRKMLLDILPGIFQQGTVAEEIIEKQYRSAHDLLLHIKKTGTSGWQQNKIHPLTPSRVKQVDEWFKKNYGGCKVTYQVFFLQGKNDVS